MTFKNFFGIIYTIRNKKFLYLEKIYALFTNSVLNTNAMFVLRILGKAAGNEARILADTDLWQCG